MEEKRILQAESLAEVLNRGQIGDCPNVLVPNLILISSTTILQIMDCAGITEFLLQVAK